MTLHTDHREWAREIPYQHFFDFIAPEADRYKVLLTIAEKLELNFTVIEIEGKRHFFVYPPAYRQKIPAGDIFPFRGQRPVILCAHYDRVVGTQGANDNSAAVFHLLKAALKMGKAETDYWIIIFTDKEELQPGEGIKDQGSFSLAEKLRAWGLGSAQVYIFDACGTGDTLLISKTTDSLFKNSESVNVYKIRQYITGLRNHALDSAHFLRLYNTLVLPTPFSDDAGFLKAGIPAQTITMLPTAEAGPYASYLRRRPDFGDMIINGQAKLSDERLRIPETWRCLNSVADSYLRLTPQFFELVVRFACELCKT
ncbi:MAG: M28 family metallopeptidase [Treponema sp.]|nr:M28 family metallopeptidase [Treponema sp.]